MVWARYGPSEYSRLEVSTSQKPCLSPLATPPYTYSVPSLLTALAAPAVGAGTWPAVTSSAQSRVAGS